MLESRTVLIRDWVGIGEIREMFVKRYKISVGEEEEVHVLNNMVTTVNNNVLYS
jgi:hypothetical protein